MKISEFIEELQEAEKKYGDKYIYVEEKSPLLPYITNSEDFISIYYDGRPNHNIKNNENN